MLEHTHASFCVLCDCHCTIFSFRLHSSAIGCNWSTFHCPMFINSFAKQRLSSVRLNLVGVCLASLVHVCLFGGSVTIWHYCVVLGPRREFQYTLVITVCTRTVAVPVFLSVTTSSRAWLTAVENSMLPHMHCKYITQGYSTNTQNKVVYQTFSSRGYREKKNVFMLP